jgi:DNA-binding CsgD family transcriptional regulator
LGHSDYEAALSLVAEAADTSNGSPFELPAIERLIEVVPADFGGYFEYANGGIACGEPNTFLVDTCGGSGKGIDFSCDTVRETIESWPLLDSSNVHTVLPVKLSDHLPGARLHRNPWYMEVMRPHGIEHELKLWLPARDGVHRGFFLVRGTGRRDFTERDRAVLALVKPYLVDIRSRWEERHRPADLTRREAEVLDLVAQGLTNGEIASRLVISAATVRTHLENVFEKLDVHTRTAAVARVRAGVAGA